MTTDWDAIVIGAGPAGSVAARQLALGGRRVLLLDKKRFPRRKVCGACLNHAAVMLLEEIGLGDVLREHDVLEPRPSGSGCDSLRAPLPDGRGSMFLQSRSDGGAAELTRLELRAGSRRLSLPLPSGRAISRTVLDQKLVDAAIRAGVTFQDGVSATVRETNGDGRIVELKHATDTVRYQPDRASVRFANDPTQPDASAFRLMNSAYAKVVLAADGLGHPSLCNVSEIHDRTARSSRIGAGCEVTEFPAEYAPGVIHMAVGRGGYVGLVCVESGVLNIAAAFDAHLIRDSGGPARAAANVLSQAGFSAIPAMSGAEWLGTPALTRSTTPVVAERLFVLGDASGYVEPFTGEGMGWALASAVALAPLAGAACDGWQPSLAQTWSREHARIVRTRQRTCRMLAAILKSPMCVRCAMFLLPMMPRLLQPLVRGVSLPTPQSLAITRCG